MPNFMVLITSRFGGETQSAAHFFNDYVLVKEYVEDTWSAYDCLTELQIYKYLGGYYSLISRRCRDNA